MTKKFFKIIFFLFFFSNLQAEIVKKIVVEGNNRVSVETIKVNGEIEIKRPKDLNSKHFSRAQRVTMDTVSH